MAPLAVTAVGADRPGILARVTGALVEQDGNICDSTMTILGGRVAMVLLIETERSPDAVEAALAGATSDLGLTVSVIAVTTADPPPPATHLLAVYGTDRPGIVHAVASALAERGVNITDLATRVLAGADQTYAMMLEVRLADDADVDEVVAAVHGALPDVEVTVHPLHGRGVGGP